MIAVDFSQPPNVCMVTPGDHIFHFECLQKWMDVKMGVPNLQAFTSTIQAGCFVLLQPAHTTQLARLGSTLNSQEGQDNNRFRNCIGCASTSRQHRLIDFSLIFTVSLLSFYKYN